MRYDKILTVIEGASPKPIGASRAFDGEAQQCLIAVATKMEAPPVMPGAIRGQCVTLVQWVVSLLLCNLHSKRHGQRHGQRHRQR